MIAAALPAVLLLPTGATLAGSPAWRGTSSTATPPTAAAPSTPITIHFARVGRGLRGANSSADTTVPFHAMLWSFGAIGGEIGGFDVTATESRRADQRACPSRSSLPLAFTDPVT
jgi:hypothetical protein